MSDQADQADEPAGGQPSSGMKTKAKTATNTGTEMEKDVGPDPVIGAGVTLLGIFLMGVGGGGDMHYLFNAGVLTAVAGAVLFVLFVTLTALRQRARDEQQPDSQES